MNRSARTACHALGLLAALAAGFGHARDERCAGNSGTSCPCRPACAPATEGHAAKPAPRDAASRVRPPSASRTVSGALEQQRQLAQTRASIERQRQELEQQQRRQELERMLTEQRRRLADDAVAAERQRFDMEQAQLRLRQQQLEWEQGRQLLEQQRRTTGAASIAEQQRLQAEQAQLQIRQQQLQWEQQRRRIEQWRMLQDQNGAAGTGGASR